jgi:transposase-like protein
MEKNEFLSESTKREIVSEVLSGRITKEQARRIYGIKSKSGILKWMRKFAGRPGSQDWFDPVPLLKTMEKPSDETAELKARIKQLEEELKISQLKGKAYQIMVEIAKEDYDIDLKKKSGAKPSKGSKKWRQKHQ